MATSYVTPALSETREYLKIHTGLDNFGLGIVNNETDASYHHGWSQRDTDGTDYSWDESHRDWNWKTDAARALDIGNFNRLRELSTWLVEECRRGAPDCADIREIIYSPDGKTVKRWDRLGIRTSGSSSHTTHTHVSWFADAEHRSKVGPFKRFFESGKVLVIDVFFAMVPSDPSGAVYVSDGINSRAVPGGQWDVTCEPLMAAGVPMVHYPSLESLFDGCGPLVTKGGGGLVQHTHAVESQSVFVAGSVTGAAAVGSQK
jgi:hypothetical protein